MKVLPRMTSLTEITASRQVQQHADAVGYHEPDGSVEHCSIAACRGQAIATFVADGPGNCGSAWPC